MSIYDAFQTITEEIDCIAIFRAYTTDTGEIKRSISVYDLENSCFACGERGTFEDICPKCGSTNITPGYGEDTTVFVSVDNLADNINYTTDVGSVKNCFRLEAGDDLMTAAIVACNPNGTQYLWHFSDDMKSDMSQALVKKSTTMTNFINHTSPPTRLVLKTLSYCNNITRLLRNIIIYIHKIFQPLNRLCMVFQN